MSGGRAGIEERGKGIKGYPVKLGESHRCHIKQPDRDDTGISTSGRMGRAFPTDASETQKRMWEPASEGNRSERFCGCDSLSGPIVAIENRETVPEGACE